MPLVGKSGSTSAGGARRSRSVKHCGLRLGAPDYNQGQMLSPVLPPRQGKGGRVMRPVCQKDLHQGKPAVRRRTVHARRGRRQAHSSPVRHGPHDLTIPPTSKSRIMALPPCLPHANREVILCYIPRKSAGWAQLNSGVITG